MPLIFADSIAIAGVNRKRIELLPGHFKTESEMARDAGVSNSALSGKNSWQCIAETLTRVNPRREERCQSLQADGEEMRSAETDPFMHRIGLRWMIWKVNTVMPAIGIFRREVQALCIQTGQEYLKLEAEEIARPGMVDGFQALTDSALAARKRNWDRFARQYPNSALSQNTGRIDR